MGKISGHVAVYHSEGEKYNADSLRVKEPENAHLQACEIRSCPVSLFRRCRFTRAPSGWPKAFVGLDLGGHAPWGTHRGVFRATRDARAQEVLCGRNAALGNSSHKQRATKDAVCMGPQ